MSDVFFASLRVAEGAGLLDKLERLLKASGAGDLLSNAHFTGLKLHFGEEGNTAFIRPLFVKRIAEYCERVGTRPFLFDTTALYSGARANAVDYIQTAMQHGFNFGYPILIADGFFGNEKQDVEIEKKHFQSVSIARLIFSLDAMVAISHFKGHLLSGFGGAIKNIAMGCASKEGKLSMHSTVAPYIETTSCTACGLCAQYCPAGAITVDKYAVIDEERCIGCGACLAHCRDHAVKIKWDVDLKPFQEKLAEYCYGVTRVKQGSILYVNFLLNITPACDCFPRSDAPIVPDIGILASRDPVAIDKASCDKVNSSIGLEGSALKGAFGKGDDKWKDLYPRVDWGYGLSYAEKIGVGEQAYTLQEVT